MALYERRQRGRKETLARGREAADAKPPDTSLEQGGDVVLQRLQRAQRCRGSSCNELRGSGRPD
jgi:hypothetical protein